MEKSFVASGLDFSFVRAESAETTAPSYLKPFTSFYTFTLIFLWMPLVLFVVSLIVSGLISVLYRDVWKQILFNQKKPDFFSADSLSDISILYHFFLSYNLRRSSGHHL